MNVKATNKVETNRYELELEVSSEEFNEAINTVYKRESKKMNIPGFRKGHAPRAFIEKYYGEEVFYEAAIDHLYRPMVMEAVEKSGLQVISIGEFKIDEIGKDKGILCKLNVVTKPEATIEGYKGIEVKKQPVTVTAEQLTFDVSGAGDSNGLTAQVEAVYQMENPTENPLSVQMSFYLEEHRGHMDSLVDVDSAVSSITADGQSLPFTIQEVETGDAAVDRFALTYTVEFPAWGTREVAVAYLSSSYGLREGTTYWTQEFTYLLSPARHWAEFGSLDITIRPPEPVPYIVRSSLPLREAEERCYTAHFDSLPDGELTFTLYPRLSITLADRLHAVLTSYQFTFAFFLLILPLTLLALPALLIFLLQRRSRRQP